MKKVSLILCGAALLLSSCVTRIITTAEAPTPSTTVVYSQPATRVIYGNSYVQPTKTTTIVKTSPSKTTTTVVNVTPLGEDVSFFLDLRAVGAAFAAANSLEEFEMLLNSSTYMLSSLDLNRDGYVDYLRVVEAIDGYNHVIVIQAVLAQNIFQDVATLTVEMSYTTPYVQIIGAPYVYGANYYVRPVFVRTPPMFTHWRAPRYNPWRSPYYWDYYPHYYHKPAPVYLSHYQAYVNTYISNNKYCNHCEFDDRVHYTDYSRTSTGVTRNDYETRHPEQSFSKRMASENTSGGSRMSAINNARDLQQRVASNTTTTTTTGRTSTSRTSETSAASGSSRTSTSSSRVNGSTGSTSSTTSGSRTSSTSTTSSSTSSSRTSGTTTTSSSASSSSSRSGSTSTTSSSSSSSRTSQTTESSSTSRRVSPATTTTTSHVSTNGSARTTTKTVNTDGSSTTTRRGATTTGSSSRTSQTGSSSRSETTTRRR